MITTYELMIAWRYLRTKQKDGFISIISAFSLAGIALGVATLIIVMSVMSGYEVELSKRLVGINGHLSISNQDHSISDYNGYLERIRKINGVEFAAPLVQEQAMLMADKTSSGAMVRGMRHEDMVNKPLLGQSVLYGRICRDKENEIMIGKTLAKNMHVAVGDRIRMVAASEETTILGTMPRIKTYTIVGVFDVGMYEYNSSTVFMPMAQAQLYFEQSGATNIEIVLSYPLQLESVKQRLYEISPPGMLLLDHASGNDHWMAALRVERNVMFVILTLIIVVAAFNIISSLMMLVKDKSKSIAILRTVGISQESVMKIFMLCGIYIGVVGTSIGSIIGVLFSANVENIRAFLENLSGLTLFDPVIYYLTKLPSHLDIRNVVVVVLVSVTLSLLATLYPSWRAARVLPAQALRYE